MKNTKAKAKKPVKKAKKSQKQVDLSNIPERFPDGIAIPQWVREMYATGKLPQTLVKVDKVPETHMPSADARVTDAERRMPEETWAQAGEKLTQEQMNLALKEFYRSNLFRAYKQYVDIRLQLVSDALHNIDPVKDPTNMARHQGTRLGLIDVEGYIISLLELEKKSQEKNEQ